MGAASTFPKAGGTQICNRSGAWQLIGEDNNGGGISFDAARARRGALKRVSQGWPFASPRPWWPFGPRPTYLRTDTQKAAVAARVCLNRYLRTPWIVVAASLVLLDQRETPGRLNRDSTLLFALLWVVAVNACENLTMRRLVAGRLPAAEKVV